MTIYIGGNHEATNYHRELHFGGWVAPNIYYLGASNVIRYKGLRIGGLSGIFKSLDYEKGYCESIPYAPHSADTITAFHYRHLEILKLLAYPSPLDIMISHDWPSRMYQYGDTAALLRRKPHFQCPLLDHLTDREDIDAQCLGSQPLMQVLDELKVCHDFNPTE